MPKLTTHDKLKNVKRITFTKEGYEKLLKKLEFLKKDRPAAVKELARAREMGDLSENGLYTAAKSRLNSIDNNIFRTEMTIKFADVAESKKSNEVQIGSRVTVEDDSNKIVYKVVGDLEANPKENKVSQASPIGHALMGKKVGDKIIVLLPIGNKEFTIKNID